MSGLMAVLVLAVLSSRAGTSGGQPVTAAHKVPVWSLLLMGAAALAVSVAELPRYPVQTAGLLAASVLLIGIFVLVDWRMHVAVLPHSVFGPGPLKWIYLTMSVQMVAAMVTTYVPLFGQRLGNLTPVAAGFLGASLAVGWTASEIVSASVNNTRVIAHVVAAAPLVMASGLALGAVTQRADAPGGRRAVGAGAADHRDRDRDRLAASVRMGNGFRRRSGRERRRGGGHQHRAADLGGLRRRPGRCRGQQGRGGEVTAARWLFALFTVLAALGFIASYQATQRRRRSPG